MPVKIQKKREDTVLRHNVQSMPLEAAFKEVSDNNAIPISSDRSLCINEYA